MVLWPELFSAEGDYVRVEPLTIAHEEDLRAASADGDLHRLWYTSIPKPEDIGTEIQRRLSLRQTGSMLPFTIIDKKSNAAVGMTTYMNIDSVNRRLEIGSTWYRQSVQRSPVNTECKLLLLRHAFEKLDCIAVEFRTHFVNIQSRRAIERLGAKLDGVLRSHMVMENGTVRDTAVYSIVAPEWPVVEAHLSCQIQKPRS